MYHSTTFQIHGTTGSSEDSIAGQTEKLLTFLEGLFSKNPDQAAGELLPGLAQMANFHPLFVHFPIALLSTFFFLDFFGSLFKNDNMRHSASWVLYLGTLGALATVLMGFQAAETIAHGAAVHPIMEQHKTYGLILTGLAVFLTLWRMLANQLIAGMANVLHLLIAAIICVLLILGADLGGLMVFKYGVGVKTVPVAENSHNHRHEH